MADAEQGPNHLQQTEHANNHAAAGDNDTQLKAPAATEEMPSVHISNSKNLKLSDGEDTTQDSSQEDEDNVPGDKKEDDVPPEQGGVDVKDAKVEEMEQGEIDEEEGDEESEEEDGEEVATGDEEDEDDEEGEDDDGEGEDSEGDDNEVEGEQSSMAEETDMVDDSETEKCPVCLCPFTDQDVGTPESCDHTFCLECILEWSKMVNTCPVDRSIFRAILVRHCVGGEVVKHIDVDEPKTAFDVQEEEDPTYCEVCGRCDREDRLLLCDGCDAGYHCECLNPPLDHIPVEEWFCPECVARNRHHDTVEVEAGDESEDEWTTIEHRPNVVRAIARTRVSEHVRAVISRARAQRLIEEEAARPSTSKRPRTTTPKRKKTTKRKTKGKRKRKTTKSPKGKGKRRRKKKTVRRKTGASKRRPGGVRTVKRTPSTTRGRIAKSLQLVKPRSGSMMPDQKIVVVKKSRMDYRLSEIGAAKLSITGSNALFEPSDDNVYAQSSKTAEPVITKPDSTAGGVPDLLGSIMAGQSVLHMKSSNITIHRDGHLSVNEEDKFKSKPKKNASSSSITSKDETGNADDKVVDGDNSNSCGQNIMEPDMHNEEKEEEEEVANQSPMDQDGGEESDESAKDENNAEGLVMNPGQDEAESDIVKDNLTQLDNAVDENDDSQEEQDPLEDPIKNVIDEEETVNSIVTNSHKEGSEGVELPEEGNMNDKLIPSDNPSKDDPETNPGTDSQDQSKDETGDISHQDQGEQGDPNDNVCNVNKTDTVTPSDSLGKEDSVSNEDDIKDGADNNIDNKHHDDKEEEEADKSDVDEGTIEAERDAAIDGIGEKAEDIEVIKVVKGERTVTRKTEAGEIEILRVDIVNKPKRKDRKGERKRHGSSSSFDSQSEEEGAIPERKKGKERSKKKKKDSKHHHSKDGEVKGKKTGDSSAEEGEVKSDDEGHGGKKKKKRRKKKKNKDTRNVIVDPNNPKILPDLSKGQKSKMDGKKSDSDGGKSRDRGNYGDLRQVIQVKRDSHPDEEAVRRYEAYWNEFGKRRGDERRVEDSSQWEQLYSFGAFTFGEGKQWENFTVQRDRSPIYDRRKEKEGVASKRIESRRSSRGDRNTGQSRDRQFRPEKETMAERAVRLEREAAKRERQQQETARRGGRERLTMAEIEARQLMHSRMDEHIERKYGKQGFLKEISKKDVDPDKEKVSARDKHGREQSYEHESKDKSREKSRHDKNRGRERKRHGREVSRSSRSHDDYSSDRHRSEDKRSYDSDMSRSSSRSASIPSDKEPEPPKKLLPKTNTVPKPPTNLPGQKPTGEVTKKKKKDKAKGKKDKKSKEAKKAAKKAKGAKAGKKDKADTVAAQFEPAGAVSTAAKRPPEANANEQPPAKKQKKIKGKKDKKKKKAAKLAAKAGKVPAPRPTCLIQDDEDPDVIDLTGEIEDRSPTVSTPPTPKPATPTKPPPKDPSPIVSSTADIRGDSHNPSSTLYDPFEPTVSPPISYSNSPSPVSSDGMLHTRKGPSSSRVSRGGADRERESNNSSKRPYSPRDAPHSRRSPQGSPPRATSSSTTNSIAKLLPALSSQTNSQINQLLGSISNNPALQSVLSASTGGARGTSLSGSQRSPSDSEQSYSKVSGLGLESPVLEERRPTKDSDNIGEVTEEDIESSAVDLYNKNSRERYLRKLHHQERVVEEVKLAIKPHYQRREINKDEYKEILRKSVNQVCHSKSGEINPVKIRNLIEGYVKKAQTKRKIGTTMKPLIITSDKSRSSSKRVVLNKLIL
ncbi:uncharacterized protein [Amphiura filiformis]|uniref:uncharacterized protein isoform X2 n=1 Tax=Amphiura filiformis TaxID=82378 RepID=UPI003B227317